MKTKMLFALVLATAAAISVTAQTETQTQRTPPSPAEMAQHKVKTMTALLNLTSAQQSQATTIFTNSAKAEQAAHADEKETRDGMQTAIKNNDTATIDQLSNTMAQSIATSMAIKAKADAAFYQILTPEQQTKLTTLQSQHIGPMEGMGGPGRGGPPAMGWR